MRADPGLAVAVLLTFVAGGLVPQAAVVTHDHARGSAPHVHAAPHQHGDAPPHVNPHPAPVDPTGTAIASARHSHRQAPFQLADHAAALAPLRVDRVVSVPPDRRSAASDGPSLVARSRGPPPLLTR